MKEKLISQIEGLQRAIDSEDIPALINFMETLRIDTRYWSPIYDFTHQLLAKSIKDYILGKKKVLRIKRLAEYQIETTDVYSVKDDVLYRNGADCKWTSVGKLYSAYKQINNTK